MFLPLARSGLWLALKHYLYIGPLSLAQGAKGRALYKDNVLRPTTYIKRVSYKVVLWFRVATFSRARDQKYKSIHPVVLAIEHCSCKCTISVGILRTPHAKTALSLKSVKNQGLAPQMKFPGTDSTANSTAI